MDDIEQIKTKIAYAREWALNHFNASEAENSKFVAEVDGELYLARPSFFVSFPDVDQMIVRPSMLGTPIGMEVHYRLSFRDDGSTAWIGKHPIWGYDMPLEVK